MISPLRVARPRNLAYFAAESLLVFGVTYGLALLTTRGGSDADSPELSAAVLLTGGMYLAILFLTQSATLGTEASLRQELVVFAVVSVATGVFAGTASWLLAGEFNRLSTLLPLQGCVAVPLAVALWRALSARLDFLNFTRERILIVGAGETAGQVCRWIGEHHAADYAVIGFADDSNRRLGQPLAMGARVQTDFRNLASFAMGRADRVIVALDEKRGKLPVRQLMELRLLGVEIEDATSFFERVSGKIAIETMLPSWLIFSEGFRTSVLRRFLKRAADIVLASILFVVALPVMAATAVAIKLDGGGPVLYRQKRMGMHGIEFNVIKFRSMRVDAERGRGPTWAEKNDPRVTRAGRVIRKLRIDELPQLVNVLCGEMSFVGPRPERRHFVDDLQNKIPYYSLRMTVRPGITGWAQVEYGYSASENDSLEKLKYDIYYIKNYNLLFDLWIVLKTFRVVLFGHGAR